LIDLPGTFATVQAKDRFNGPYWRFPAEIAAFVLALD
jgi:hypothetical protein